jgi:hypothetical protein
MMPLIHAVRLLWAHERSLGRYSPIEELTLDLEALDTADLQALHDRIAARVRPPSTVHQSTITGELVSPGRKRRVV